MRYERPKSNDWVEISGADELSMRELDSLYQTSRAEWNKVISIVVVDHGFARRGQLCGKPIDVMELTVKQWDWLRASILEATRDEALDPEV